MPFSYLFSFGWLEEHVRNSPSRYLRWSTVERRSTVLQPTLIKPRYTEKTEFRLGMVQSPSSYCSEFGRFYWSFIPPFPYNNRHLMLNYRFEMGVEEIAAGVQLCLRYAHPHQVRILWITGNDRCWLQTSFNAYESILAFFQSQEFEIFPLSHR